MGHSIKTVLDAFDAKAEQFKKFNSSYRRIQEVKEYVAQVLEVKEQTAAYQEEKFRTGITRLSRAMKKKDTLDDAIDEFNKLGYMVIPIDKSIDSLVEDVTVWAFDRRLNEAESSKQMLKVMEETGEVAAALARGQQDELRDGIGDVIVTLIILAEQNGMSLHECLEQAYTEIADRKGRMVNGVFVKDGD